jgi:hypothetical protein
MSSNVQLAPCPRCNYPHNQGQVSYIGFNPYVDPKINCANCGQYYDGRTNFANLAPANAYAKGCLMHLVFFIVGCILLGFVVVVLAVLGSL